MAAVKETRQIRYDAIVRGTTNFIPFAVVNQDKDDKNPTGNASKWEANHEYKVGDIITMPFYEDTFYFQVNEDFTSQETFTQKFLTPIGEYKPYNLNGSILMLTVKKKAYDGDEYIRTSKPTTYWKQLRDVSSENGMDDAIFRITVDCDDPTAGEITPLWASEGNGFVEVFHGMYGANPELGEMTFRIPKKCTFIDPGSYYFDIRILQKQEQWVGRNSENPTYLLAFGYLDIYGTPNNRATTFNPYINPQKGDQESGDLG